MRLRPGVAASHRGNPCAAGAARRVDPCHQPGEAGGTGPLGAMVARRRTRALWHSGSACLRCAAVGQREADRVLAPLNFPHGVLPARAGGPSCSTTCTHSCGHDRAAGGRSCPGLAVIPLGRGPVAGNSLVFSGVSVTLPSAASFRVAAMLARLARLECPLVPGAAVLYLLRLRIRSLASCLLVSAVSLALPDPLAAGSSPGSSL